MTTNNTTNRILVLGSTGKTGSRVFQQLKAKGLNLRPGSRSAAIPFDWENESTWEPVLQNIDSVFVSYQPDLAVPAAVPAIDKFSKLAVANGVKKLVLLSGRGEPEAQACEQLIIDAGVEYTIIRASWFCQNFSEGYLVESIIAGHVALPVPPMGEPFIDIDDIAEIAVEALTNDKHNGQVYEVTGPQLLTFEEAVNEIAKATGKPIQYQHIPMEEYKALLKEFNIPQVYIGLLSYLFSEILDGRNAHVNDGVQRALGRPATDFATFVKKSIAAGVWG
jgi:uncharacterized protein YbjT (DUF2867 family)